MKEIVYRNVDTVWFSIDIFKINEDEDLDEQLDAQINDKSHWENEYFEASTARDATFLAERLLTRNDDYNYAMITINRYSQDNSEEKCEDCTIIGEIWSEEIKDDSESTN